MKRISSDFWLLFQKKPWSSGLDGCHFTLFGKKISEGLKLRGRRDVGHCSGDTS